MNKGKKQNAIRNINIKKPVVVAEKPKEPVVAAEKPKEQVIVINNDKKKKKENKTTVKELKNAIPKKLRMTKYEQTDDQQVRVYKNYIQPQLLDNDTNDPNNDLVQSIKDVFGKDNKEKLNQPLPSFIYENEAVRQKLANDLFNPEDETVNPTIPDENKAALTIQKGLKEPLEKRKKLNELQKLVSNTPYKYTDPKENLISNSLEGIVSTAKKDKTDKLNKSAKIITRAMTRAKNAKDNKMIKEDFEVAKLVNSFDENPDGMYVRSIRKGNKVVGLSYETSQKKAERMKPKNLISNFNDTEKPKKVYRVYKSQKTKLEKEFKDELGKSFRNASTEPRGPGRPTLKSYRDANPDNFKGII